MAELANEGSKLISVIFCPDDPQPVSQEQPATTLAVPVSADPPLKTAPTSSPTSAPDSAGEIPADVMENVAVLTWPNEKAPDGISTVYLVGTAHVSKASCEDVRVVIRVVKPSLVFLELCQSRVRQLLPPKKEKLSEFLDVEIGEEFRVAASEAKALKAVLIVGDRPVEVEGLKEEDVMTQTLAAVGAKYPSLKTALIDERNEYMVSTLHNAATLHSPIVAVVGRGHLPGMRQNWNRTDIDIEALMIIPQVKHSRSIGWKTVLGVGSLCALVAVGYSRRR